MKQNIKREVFDKKAPFSNISVGVVGVILGPIAAAIMVSISFKNIGYQKYIKYVILFTIAITIGYIYLSTSVNPGVEDFVENGNDSFRLLWLIYVIFQTKGVKKWGEENPNKKYKNGILGLLWGLLGFFLFYLALLLFFITTTNTPSNISSISKVDSILETQQIRHDKVLKEYTKIGQNNTIFTKESLKNIIKANLNVIEFLEDEKLRGFDGFKKAYEEDNGVGVETNKDIENIKNERIYMINVEIDVFKANTDLDTFLLENFDSIKLLDTGFNIPEELLPKYNELLSNIEKKEKGIDSSIPKD